VTRGGVKIATRQRRLPEAWLKQPDFEETAAIARETAGEEMVMMGLRLAEGISRARLEALAGRPVEALFGDALRRLVDGGFVALDDKRLAATAAGRQRLNAVLGTLFA
jgi:oxygen-independent coproporphyrinogen-3 oxidase